MSDVDINWFGKEFLAEATAVNEEAAKTAAFVVEGVAKKSFKKGGLSGKLIRRGKNFHRPSAPGQPPREDFGFLKSSVTTVIDGIAFRDTRRVGSDNSLKERDPVAFVGSDIKFIKKKLRKKKGFIKNIKSAVQYGFFLEVGTKNMAARPWLRPALKKSGATILRIFQKANS